MGCRSKSRPSRWIGLSQSCRGRIYSPLIASVAESGDMLGGLLRESNAGPAENADTWIPHLVRRLNEVRVRIDAGFTDNDTLEALEDRDIEYLGRLRSHSGLCGTPGTPRINWMRCAETRGHYRLSLNF
jgi:hypothetical protein